MWLRNKHGATIFAVLLALVIAALPAPKIRHVVPPFGVVRLREAGLAAADSAGEIVAYDAEDGSPRDVVELVGYTLDDVASTRVEATRVVRPGEAVRLTLVWRCLREMETSYTVFTHLLDEGQQIRGQQDNPPVGGRYPTTLWVPGEVIVDEYAIAVRPGAPPGSYLVEVGLYDPATMERLREWYDPPAVPALAKLLDAEDLDVRRRAAILLGQHAAHAVTHKTVVVDDE